MIELVERPDESPVCPHCETVVKNMHFQLLSKWFGRRYVYFCSSCKKILSVSHRKGFWMG